MNIEHTTIPKSNQINSDDLIAGPRTITIAEVRLTEGDQPLSIHYANDAGRPYKPCKSMRRVLIAIWGKDGSAYIGRRLTLYRDAAVKFGSDDVGGIRISHASHIDGKQTLALTVTRGKRKPYTVEPLANEETGDAVATRGTAQLKAWWTAQPKEARDRMQASLDGWKAIAAEADKKGGAA